MQLGDFGKGFISNWTQLLTLSFLRDILYELACMGDLPLPQTSGPGNKRDRDQVDSLTEGSETVKSRSGASEEPRRITGSRRVSSQYALQTNQNMQNPLIPIQDTSTPSTLRTSGEECGNFTYFQFDTVPPLNFELFPATDVVDHLSYGPIASDGSWPTVGPNIFYDQMAALFSTPFGEMTEEELAMAILNASATETPPNDGANVLCQAPVDPR
jgi:hypothetical protein